MTEARHDLLCIGGGPAGLAAARAYRRAGGGGRVAILSDEGRLPYSRPPLTKELLRGESDERSLAIEQESFFDEQRIELIAGRAVALDAGARRLSLSGGRELRYVQAVLATGAEPVRPEIHGLDRPRVHVIRTLDHLRELLTHHEPGTRFAVIGSGFIGCEIASSLRARGNDVTMVSAESAPNVARLGDEAARRIRSWLAQDGVELHLGSELCGLAPSRSGSPQDRAPLLLSLERTGERRGGVETPSLGERAEIEADVVVLASGVSPRSELAAAAGLELHDGAVPADSGMRTSAPGLFVAGDVAAAEHALAGRRLRVEHWGDALSQGEVAGANAAGMDRSWRSVPGFWSTIGSRTLKHVAWGDGFETSRLEEGADGSFTVRYGAGGRLVGVLSFENDEEYERGRRLIAEGAPWS
jgi:3-phenylpropionate/trans-cinnamate dioxygenase ferredoxin reductase subunit